MYIPGNLKMRNWIRIYVILQPYCVLYEYVQYTSVTTYLVRNIRSHKNTEVKQRGPRLYVQYLDIL